jgi:hypothetical protein
MKKVIAIFLVTVIGLVSFSGCAKSKRIKTKVEVIENGETKVVDKTIKAVPYGWMNENKKRIDGVEYKVKGWNVFWSIVLVETVVAPILITGLDIMEPVGLESESESNIKIVK